MARRKQYEKIDINVEPFLSIMAIVLKLISLILVVIVMRIAINPLGRKIVALPDLYEGRGNIDKPKEPSYIDCHPEGLVLYPGNTKVGWDELQRPNNAVEALLDKVQARKDNEYVVVIVRPGSVKFYRTVRSLIGKRPIDVGYDAIDAEYKVDCHEAQKALAVSK